jgi:hypothetical protein
MYEKKESLLELTISDPILVVDDSVSIEGIVDLLNKERQVASGLQLTTKGQELLLIQSTAVGGEDSERLPNWWVVPLPSWLHSMIEIKKEIVAEGTPWMAATGHQEKKLWLYRVPSLRR